MKIAIIGALPEEIQMIHEQMTDTAEEQLGTYSIRTGRIGEHEIVVGHCGVGKVNAAACTTAVILRHRPDYVINSGVSGSLIRLAAPLSTVIARDVGFHDTDPIMLKYSPCRQWFECDERLIRAAQESNPERSLVGRVVSGDRFVNDSALSAALRDDLGGSAVDMESAAIGQVCYCFGVPFLALRSISDMADENADESYDDNLESAADASARTALGIISRL